jgi:2-phosphosulfolactate phosphatase
VGLPGPKSPEAEAAIGAFERAVQNLHPVVSGYSSVEELIDRGFAADVDLAARLDASRSVPWLHDGAFLGWDVHPMRALASP